MKVIEAHIVGILFWYVENFAALFGWPEAAFDNSWLGSKPSVLGTSVLWVTCNSAWEAM